MGKTDSTGRTMGRSKHAIDTAEERRKSIHSILARAKRKRRAWKRRRKGAFGFIRRAWRNLIPSSKSAHALGASSDGIEPDSRQNWYSLDRPEVSIIILNFNKSRLTQECLRSISRYTEGHQYEVIVVDNGSQLDDFENLATFEGDFRLVRLGINRYFGEGNNIGAGFAKGEYLVFINNDVTVTSHWLEPLIEAFKKYPDCGVAGPKFVFPDGVLQEAGGFVNTDGIAVQIGKWERGNSKRYRSDRVVDYVSAATAVVKREVFEQICGFDLLYEPLYFEDADLCLKIGALGLKTYYIANSRVVHHENATTSDQKLGFQFQGCLDENRKKFIERWSAYLQSGRHIDPEISEGTEFDKCANVDKIKGRAICVFFGKALGTDELSRSVLTTLSLLREAGFESAIATQELYSSLRIKRLAQLFGLRLGVVECLKISELREHPSFDLAVLIGRAASTTAGASDLHGIAAEQILWNWDQCGFDRFQTDLENLLAKPASR